MPDNKFTPADNSDFSPPEHRLSEISRNYEEFFSTARDGFYISTRVGRFIDCNNALVEMLAYRDKEEVLRIDLNTDLWMNSADRRRFQSIIEREGYVRDYEAVFKRKGGSPLFVTLSTHVWRDSRGEICGYRGLVVDRTQEKFIRDQLHASEIKYRELFEKIRDGVFVVDPKGIVVDCNQALCDIIGYSRDEFLGMNYYKYLFLSRDDVMQFRRLFRRVGEIKDYEIQIIRKDGAIRDISLSGYARRNHAGAIAGYQGLMRDITEAKRLRVQLLQAERLSAMGKMASQLAHELNNPLYGIINCLELVKEVVPPDDKRRKYLDLAASECKRTSGLLTKMLSFFKPGDEQRSAADVNRLLDETLLFYERQFKSLNIQVRTALDPGLPQVMVVESQMKQVFINMILNAITAMPQGGTLSVGSCALTETRAITVTFSDTGVGIGPENLDRIFEAFFTTKREVKGVGLGLTVCYGLVEEHGGKIDVRSEIGKGTEFTIRLPVDPTETISATGRGGRRSRKSAGCRSSASWK
jgi:two-component system NtrC family sensor kinase